MVICDHILTYIINRTSVLVRKSSVDLSLMLVLEFEGETPGPNLHCKKTKQHSYKFSTANTMNNI
jgi:hypothetical protein